MGRLRGAQRMPGGDGRVVTVTDVAEDEHPGPGAQLPGGRRRPRSGGVLRVQEHSSRDAGGQGTARVMTVLRTADTQTRRLIRGLHATTPPARAGGRAAGRAGREQAAAQARHSRWGGGQQRARIAMTDAEVAPLADGRTLCGHQRPEGVPTGPVWSCRRRGGPDADERTSQRWSTCAASRGWRAWWRTREVRTAARGAATGRVELVRTRLDRGRRQGDGQYEGCGGAGAGRKGAFRARAASRRAALAWTDVPGTTASSTECAP